MRHQKTQPQGADVNDRGPQGATPLYNALHKGNEPLALWLLEQGPTPWPLRSTATPCCIWPRSCA